MISVSSYDSHPVFDEISNSFEKNIVTYLGQKREFPLKTFDRGLRDLICRSNELTVSS